MSALPKLHIPSESFPQPTDQAVVRPRRQNYYQKQEKTREQIIQTPTQNRVENTQVRSSQLQRLPTNLKVLSIIQQYSFGITILSVLASVGLYVANVRTPQNWSQQYKNLETLQRQERQLIEINETLKYQIASQSEKQQQTELKTAAIFVPAANVIENQVDTEAAENSALFKQMSLGY
jgi:hypothetical protein